MVSARQHDSCFMVWNNAKCRSNVREAQVRVWWVGSSRTYKCTRRSEGAEQYPHRGMHMKRSSKAVDRWVTGVMTKPSCSASLDTLTLEKL
jgi:hypothetical protein